MAGHSHFANIKHRKGKADKIKAKVFTKIAREIIAACKAGMPDPDHNPRLKAAIAAGRAQNMPNDRIKGAISQAVSAGNTDNFDPMRYEGYGVGGVAVIVEALTDNRNRTASDVRSAFNKYAGVLGETNSVAFNFEKVGIIEYPVSKASADAMLEAVIDAGADDCESGEIMHTIYCKPDDLNIVREALLKKFGDAESAKVSWKALNTIPVSGENAESLFKMIEMLEDFDDVQFVVTNADFDEASLSKLAS
jgi:YebC/PmpR family DNA-binding regulatory protein